MDNKIKRNLQIMGFVYLLMGILTIIIPLVIAFYVSDDSIEAFALFVVIIDLIWPLIIANFTAALFAWLGVPMKVIFSALIILGISIVGLIIAYLIFFGSDGSGFDNMETAVLFSFLIANIVVSSIALIVAILCNKKMEDVRVAKIEHIKDTYKDWPLECTHCGRALPYGNKNCPYCGYRMVQ